MSPTSNQMYDFATSTLQIFIFNCTSFQNRIKEKKVSVFLFEIVMQCLPVRIITGKRHERGYISDNHLNETG